MKLNTTTWIYPPRTSTCTPFEQAKALARFDLQAQYKYNDSNVIVQFAGGNITLWSRHCTPIKNYPLPPSLENELRATIRILGLDPQGHHRFNGGLLHFKHTAVKNQIVLWDILVMNGEYLIGTPYYERLGMLQTAANGPHCFTNGDGTELEVGRKITDHVFIPVTLDNWDEAWENIQKLNRQYANPLLEGLCLKQPKHKLEYGYSEKNNDGLMVKCRVVTGRHLC